MSDPGAISSSAARDLSDLLLKHAAELNGFLDQLETDAQPAEFDALRGMIGRILGETYVAALQPIFARYPDLSRPPFHRDWRRAKSLPPLGQHV